MSGSSSLLRYIGHMSLRHNHDATDRELLAHFATWRDEEAFAILVERHGPMIWGVCRRVLRDVHEAEDAFQATLLVLARKAGAIRQPEALGNWLYGVAYRTAMECRAKAARRRLWETELTEEPTVEPSSSVVWNDLRIVLDEEINRLPERYRAPFVLCYLEGQTNEQAANQLGCPKGTVLSRLSWARKRLRTRLAQRGVALESSAGFTTGLLSPMVPRELAISSVRMARLFACGQRVASVEVIKLAKGVMTAMFTDKCKYLTVALVALALFGSSVVGMSQLTPASPAKDTEQIAASPKGENALQTLTALEKRVWEATKKKDTKTLRKLCVEEYCAILSDGTQLTRDEICDLLPIVEISSYSMSDVRLISLGSDAAILTYKAKSQTIILGEKVDEETRIASTWTRRNGEWQNVFYQETKIEE